MVPGHPDGAVTVHLGLGPPRRGGPRGAGVGFNAYLLRTADAPLCRGRRRSTKTGGTYDLCVTKVHNIEHRGSFAQHDLEHPKLRQARARTRWPGTRRWSASIIRYATVDEAKKNPNFAHERQATSGTLVNKVGYSPQGETPGNDESFFPDAWRYDHEDAVIAARCRTSGAWRST